MTNTNNGEATPTTILTLEERIQDCKDQAERIVGNTLFAKVVQFEIPDIPWEDFKRVTDEKKRFTVSGSRVACIINAPECQINLLSVPVKMITTYEVIEMP